MQICFPKGTDLIVIFDVQHLQVTRTELHSKLLASHSLGMPCDLGRAFAPQSSV